MTFRNPARGAVARKLVGLSAVLMLVGTAVVGGPATAAARDAAGQRGVNQAAGAHPGGRATTQLLGQIVRTGPMAKLTAADGTQDDDFGGSVAISGFTAVVGAQNANTSTGAAYVFTKTASGWAQQAKLTASDGASYDNFGGSVGISGSTIVVGAREGPMPRTGAAYIFERRGTTWVQEAKLTALDASAGAEFGVSVGISRSTVVVGAPFHRPAGAAYVFVHSGSSWVQQAEFTMPALPDLPTEFGSAVAVSGATVVVGMNQPGADGKGYAFVYGRTGNTWAPQATLTNSDGNPFDLFGDTLSFSGSTVVVGAYGKNSQTGTLQVGSVYVFLRSGTTWIQQAEIADPTGQVFDHFGFEMAISDSILMVGARGGVYLFRREGGAWLQLSIVSGCPPCRWDSIALSDTERVDSARDLRIAVVGATAQQTITGAAYAFRVY